MVRLGLLRLFYGPFKLNKNKVVLRLYGSMALRLRQNCSNVLQDAGVAGARGLELVVHEALSY